MSFQVEKLTEKTHQILSIHIKWSYVLGAPNQGLRPQTPAPNVDRETFLNSMSFSMCFLDEIFDLKLIEFFNSMSFHKVKIG